MRIAIDARLWGLKNTGLGRYTIRLITELAEIDDQNEYHLLVRQELFDNKPILPSNFHFHMLEARHYSFAEQFAVPAILSKIKPDLLHVPHFNIPIFWPGKLMVTIHDLIKQTSVGPQTTTLPKPIYWFKWFVHQFVIKQATRRAVKIFVPSQYTKGQLVKHYSVDEAKILVTYEAPDPLFFENRRKGPNILTKIIKALQKKQPEVSISPAQKQILQKYELTNPFLIYTGNAYPHKNLPVLLTALKMINQQQSEPVHLAIVGARDNFQQTLLNQIIEAGVEAEVHLLGFVPDNELRELYRLSIAFVTPALIEGFGLPGLEAMAAGTPVIAAQASCLPEIYTNHALYFNPQDPTDLVNKIEEVLSYSATKRERVMDQATKYSQSFSWTRMAQQTLQAYVSV